jgi:O-methyltransferase
VTNEKTKVIVFGAGNCGKRLAMTIKNRNDPFDIIAFVDNNPQLQGTFLFDRPIIHPGDIASFDYDQITIASMDKSDIFDQLVNKCGVEPDVIRDIISFHLENKNARIAALINSAKLIYDNNIVGAVAELGVFQGEFVQYINELFPDRAFYLFDTFEGFHNSDVEKEKEIGTNGIFEYSYNFSETSIELIMKKIKNPEKCIVKKGIFPETAKDLEDNFAFVSLDADLYQPMLEGLKYFYPRLSKGGYIFVHDFFSYMFTGTSKAVMEYKDEMDIQIVPMGDDCSVIIPKK